jgi:hypothetical protein
VDETIVARWATLRAELVADPAVVPATLAASEQHLEQAMAFGRAVTRRWIEAGGFR